MRFRVLARNSGDLAQTIVSRYTSRPLNNAFPGGSIESGPSLAEALLADETRSLAKEYYSLANAKNLLSKAYRLLTEANKSLAEAIKCMFPLASNTPLGLIRITIRDALWITTSRSVARQRDRS